MAAVVVNIVHIAKEQMQPPYLLDDKPVPYISSLLDSRQMLGEPHRLTANEGKSFQGSVVVGMGFILEPDEAQAFIKKNSRNKDVLFPYLNGEDLNSGPDQSPSRWVINFFDWPLEKAETYTEPMKIVREKVYPVRAKVNREAHRKYWWHYGDKRPALYRTIAPLKRVLIRPRVSDTHAPVFVPRGWVYSEATVVFIFDEDSYFAVMQSSVHETWVRKYASTLKGDVRYSPSDVFDTFPFPSNSYLRSLESVGERYHEHRRRIMQSHQEGLTKTYNRFHDSDERNVDIARLRELHVEMDRAVAAAYGWDDLDLDHGFHETAQGVRFTIGESARREVLARLLKLNHERYEEEVRQGLHEKGGGRKGKGTRKAQSKKQRTKSEKMSESKQERLL
jgi:hypothetical protein